jgi:ATP-dependent Clp protease adaptor protein ClpS
VTDTELPQIPGIAETSPINYHKTMVGLGKNGTKSAAKQEERLKEPEEFQVILLNDHYTTMDFVVEVLVVIFHKNPEDANRIMLEVHKNGRGLAGIYPWDIAITKAEQVHTAARKYEFPLLCIVEPV